MGVDKKCVCKICNCGKHRCPHHPITHATVDSGHYSTEYETEFVPRRGAMQKSFKPTYARNDTNGPMANETTHKVDFIPHPLDHKIYRPGNAWAPPEGQFEKSTVYKMEFDPKPYAKVAPIKREQLRAVAGPFGGEPTYKTDYKKWDLERPYRHSSGGDWAPPTEKFEGVSTAKTDFIGYYEPPRRPFKPAPTVNTSDLPFAGSTDYKDAYVRHPLEGRYQKQKEVWQPTGVPMDGLTTFQRDFTPKAYARPEMMRPTNQVHNTEAPFAEDTTHRTDFKEWPLDRHHVHRAPEYQKPDGTIDGVTSYKSEYVALPFVKEALMRPTQRMRNTGPFDGTTNYREHYIQHPYAKANPVQSNHDYAPPSVPFEGESTFTSHYHAHPLAPSKSFKPTSSTIKSDAPFDGTTLYTTEYTPKQIEPCPAAMLETPRSKFKLSEVDPTGHRFYEPTNLVEAY
jgi:hypothetical protein